MKGSKEDFYVDFIHMRNKKILCGSLVSRREKQSIMQDQNNCSLGGATTKLSKHGKQML